MRKSLRVIAVMAGLALLFGVLLALMAPHLLDPNAYKGRISALIKARTGHDLVLGGDIRVSVLPWLVLEANSVQLRNAPGFDATPLLRAGHGVMRIKWLPLLFEHTVELDRVHLDDAAVHLQRDVQGRTNWQAPTGTSANTKAQDVNADAALALLQLGEVELRNAQLDWDDRQTGRYYRFTNIDLATTRYVPRRSLTVDLKFAVSPSRTASSWPAHLLLRINARPAARKYTLDKAEMVLGPVDDLTVHLTGRAELDFASQRLSVSDIAVRVADLQLNGVMQVQQMLDKPELRGVLRITEFNPSALLAMLDRLPPHAEPGVLRRLSGSVGIQANRGGIHFAPVVMHIDDTALSGQLEVRDFAAPHWNFKLEADALNLDRYFPPAEATAGQRLPTVSLPIDWLRRIRIDGMIHIGHLQSQHVLSSDVRLTVTSQAGAPPAPEPANSAASP